MIGAATVTRTVVEATPPPLVTLRRTLYAPAVVKVCVAFWVVTAGVESPKSHDTAVDSARPWRCS